MTNCPDGLTLRSSSAAGRSKAKNDNAISAILKTRRDFTSQGVARRIVAPCAHWRARLYLGCSSDLDRYPRGFSGHLARPARTIQNFSAKNVKLSPPALV